jgi:hypothetical protein
VTTVIDDVCDEFGWDEQTVEQVQAACRVLELALKLQDYDIKDEQLAGFGELAKELLYEIKRVLDGSCCEP